MASLPEQRHGTVHGDPSKKSTAPMLENKERWNGRETITIGQ